MSQLRLLHSYRDITICRGSARNLYLYGALRAMCSEGSIACHVYRDTGPRVLRSLPKDLVQPGGKITSQEFRSSTGVEPTTFESESRCFTARPRPPTHFIKSIKNVYFCVFNVLIIIKFDTFQVSRGLNRSDTCCFNFFIMFIFSGMILI